MRKKVKYTLLSIVFGMVLTACATEEETPAWVDNYPADPGYYIGIGGSNTGNNASDRKKASAAAYADLAAQISAQVSSTLVVATRIGKDGNVTETVNRGITQTVDQNLKSVETVDTWMSHRRGAWVYVRLSKVQWAMMVNKAISEISERANSVVRPISSKAQNVAEDMAALGRAFNLLKESAWGLTVKNTSLSGGGFLLDAINTLVSSYVTSMRIDLSSPKPSSAKFGEEVIIKGIVSFGGRISGAFPLVASAGDAVSNTVTNADGSFSLSIKPVPKVAGSVSIAIGPDFSIWDIPATDFAAVSTVLNVNVEPVFLGLKISKQSSDNLDFLDQGVRNWITTLPIVVELTAPDRGDAQMEFRWSVNDTPRSSDKTPFLSEIGASVTLTRGGNTLFVKDLRPFKDGGSNWQQAHTRAAQGFLENLDKNESLPNEILESFLK